MCEGFTKEFDQISEYFFLDRPKKYEEKSFSKLYFILCFVNKAGRIFVLVRRRDLARRSVGWLALKHNIVFET